MKLLRSYFIFTLLLICSVGVLHAQTTLSAGDIAFIGLYMDGSGGVNDGFTFITLKAMDAGTVIYFTDNGWDGATPWVASTSEVHWSWTAPSGGTPIGTIVYVYWTSGTTPIVTSGTASSFLYGTAWHYASGGDQILAYQISGSWSGRPSSPTFIAAIDADYNTSFDVNSGWSTGTVTSGSEETFCALPSGLTNGTNCVSLVNATSLVSSKTAYEWDNYKYTGSLTGSVEAVRDAINTSSNWTGNDDGTINISSGYSAVNISTLSSEINITGNGVTIADEDVTPSTSDYTDFGSTDVASGTVIRTFTVQNTGAGTLSLTGSSPYITIGGTNSGDFSVTAIPASSIAATTGTTTFSITFNPSGSGTRSATLSIANNDADENPYNFSIQGVGTAPEPEMSISGNSVEIVDGDATPSTSDHTDFGYADINTGTLTYTYTIENQGLAALSLSGSPIVSSSSSDFTVTQPSVSSIAASGSTTFQVTFNPTATGTRTASISIDNNDNNENPYNFTVQGYGTSQNLVAGDIAFIGYNSDDPDGFTFIALNDIPATEMIYFSEEGWNSSAWSGSSVETHYAWQAPAGGLAIGSIVYIYESAANVLTASTGTISGVLSGSSFNFSGGDQVLAYQSGSGVKPASPTFIAGLHADYFSTNYNSTTTWSQSASAGEQNASTVPTGLTNGQNCVSLFPATTEEDNAKYTGTLTGTSDAIRLAINTYTNWSSKSDTYYDISSAGYAAPSITYSPEINIQGNSTTIADGDVTPSSADYTDFGTANVTAGTLSRTFTIQNTGKASLTLSGTPKVVVSGTNSSDFSVTTQPTSPVAATSGTTTFTVQFDPSGTGTRSATISIANNDANENPYDFSIQGTGLSTITFTDGSGFSQSITPGSSDQPIGRFRLSGDASGAALTSASIKLDGTRTGLSNLKLWISADESFGSDVQIGSTVAADPVDGNAVSFTGLSNSISTSGTYYFITGDVAAIPTGIVQGVLVQNSDLTISNGTLSGTIDNAPLSNGITPLPVELSCFTAAAADNAAVLSWQTAIEVNNYGFEIERGVRSSEFRVLSSELGVLSYEKIGFVAGAGNSNGVKEYLFTDNTVKAGRYSYRLKQIDNDGTYKYSGETEVTIVLPKEFALNQNYPNPFNPTTTIKYDIAEGSQYLVTLRVFDIAGREVATLVNEVKEPGRYTATFDASGFASGIYYCRMQAGTFTATKKLLLIK